MGKKDEAVLEIRKVIQQQGRIVNENFLSVDGVLNHRIQPEIILLAAKILSQRFKGKQIDIVVTAEAAGNVLAYELAKQLEIDALYAKKGDPLTMENPLFRFVESPTKRVSQCLSISRNYLKPEMNVLVVDDFLFEGGTADALAQMIQDARANLVGFGFIIRKFKSGLELLQKKYPGVPIESIVNIAKLDVENNEIILED